jgi:formate dehydrogenase major subunit
VPGLGTTFGRGGATTAQQDLQFSDAILIMGSSMAENHPVGFRWVMKAREQGARVIHVDPRFSRTSAMADLWVPLRAGTDIAFLGGLVNYVLANGREFREYVTHYTNAGMILREDVRDTEDLGGVFSGWNEDTSTYDAATWRYEGAPLAPQQTRPRESGGHAQDRGGESARLSEYERDWTLEHPRCVFQMLKRHFARYTPETVEQICGVPRDAFLDVADAFVSASGPDRTGAICYAVGWTHHSTGVQVIRTAAILQLLLGNIGRPGGGILALRGHASIQGSTDIPTLYDILPGYLPMPVHGADGARFSSYLEQHTKRTGLWAAFDAYTISFLKSWYGDAATRENDFGFDYLPRVTGDHSHIGYWMEMADGKLDGLFVMGQNPAVGAPNSRMERKALSRLKWLVVRDMAETETASFWYDSPEVERGELQPASIATEVFLFPAAGHVEKAGTFTNTQRLLQFREKAIDPPGDARSESWFIYHLGRRLRARAEADPSRRNAPLNALTWNYATRGADGEPDAEEILQEINGRSLEDGTLLHGYQALRNDGTTACGCWIYSGVFPAPLENKARKRAPHGRYGHGWGFAWPADHRIIYNRASARPDGRPWSDRKALIWWDASRRVWTGHDTPDFDPDKPPDYIPPPGATGTAGLRGDAPFVLHDDGTGWLWVSSGLKDGPLPAHYEPLESPVGNLLYPDRPTNPAADPLEREDNPYAVSPADPRFPHVLTTYRLTEHHTGGAMSRILPHLAELQPALFCELSPELAAECGVEPGGWVTVTTPRGLVEARALVTRRMRSLTVQGRRVHQVALPFQFGPRGLATGDIVNDLLALSEEPNVRIMESKALVCHVAPGRRPRGEAALDWMRQRMEQP